MREPVSISAVAITVTEPPFSILRAKPKKRRGISKALIGETESSMEDIKKAASLKIGYGEAYYNIGLNYYDLRDEENAKINFKKADELGYKIENLTSYLNK